MTYVRYYTDLGKLYEEACADVFDHFHQVAAQNFAGDQIRKARVPYTPVFPGEVRFNLPGIFENILLDLEAIP